MTSQRFSMTFNCRHMSLISVTPYYDGLTFNARASSMLHAGMFPGRLAVSALTRLGISAICRAPASVDPMKQSCRKGITGPHSVCDGNLISLSFNVFAFKKQHASRAAAGNADGIQTELARGAAAKILQP